MYPGLHKFCFLVAIVASSLTIAVNGQAPKSISPSSGKALCSALTPADFSSAGVPVSSLQQANLDNPESAYCVYNSKAGKVEFDIFFPAGKNAQEVSATENTSVREIGGRSQPVTVPGAASGHFIPDNGSGASIVVRKGKAVFDINIPKAANAQKELISLAEIVLRRLK